MLRTTRMLALAGALVAAACGGGGGDGGEAVDVSGSSTVAPISTRVAELFEDSGSEAVVNVDGPGTGDGFVLFCEGETDISDASRAIKPEEAETCEENGIEYIELQVAYDGLAVVTHPDNDIACLNFADLYALTGPESQGFETWRDAQELAEELGSDTALPDAPLDITAPGEESGTYDSYVELVLTDIAEERSQEPQTRPDYQSSSDDNIILQGVEGSESSFGWVGLAYVSESAGAVKALPIAAEPGGECVEPSPETVSSGEYPISRPLFIYVNATSLEDEPAVEQYVDFYLSDEGLAAVAEVGYVDLSEEDLAATRTVWETKETGTRETE